MTTRFTPTFILYDLSLNNIQTDYASRGDYPLYYIVYSSKVKYLNSTFSTTHMPRSNAAELITLRVNIVKELRNKWKKERERNPYVNEHFGGFVNELLHDILEKDEFLRHYAPFLSEEGCTRDTLYIKDFKENKITEIHLSENKLHWSLCNSFACFHIQFAMATPRVAKLNLELETIDADIEEAGQQVKKITSSRRRRNTISRN